ncbi:MAG: GspH/FimT family pseudopilin [Halioglobus sp.]
MQTLETGRSPSRPFVRSTAQRGFSLLELLVALFVVMIVTSLVTLNVNSGGQDLKLEASIRSLANLSSYALDEAQMNGTDMGLFIERIDSGRASFYRYSWRQRDGQEWREPERDRDLFSPREFPPEVELDLSLEDLPVPDFGVKTEAENPVPQIVFYASGETTPGYLEFRSSENGEILWVVEWDLLGRFKLLLRGEPDEA